jgi:excisionase family DNA binding protein
VDEAPEAYRGLAHLLRRYRARDAPSKEPLPPMATESRFLTLNDVADVLNISTSQAYALVRNEELEAIKIGGRGQWRVEATELEAYIERLYAESERFVAEHPFSEDEPTEVD